MSNREEAKQIIDKLPEYKIEKILLFLKGIEFDDEMEDDIFCENMVQKYLNDDSPDKYDTITIEEFAKQEGIVL
jgi:hypothetical protein